MKLFFRTCRRIFPGICALLIIALSGAAAEESGFSVSSFIPEEADTGTLSVLHPASLQETEEHTPVTFIRSEPMERKEEPPILLFSLQNAVDSEQTDEVFDLSIETGDSQPERALLTISQLRAKYPAGKYWNHADNPGKEKEYNNADGWTEIPCPENHTELIDTELQTCNTYYSQNTRGAQCYGYADQLGYDATGTDPETWEKRTDSGVLYSLKAGDIVRYLDDMHSIFVIDVSGEDVYYTECNESATCVIRWDSHTTKGEISETFTYVRVCPVEVLVYDEYCHCSADVSGYYLCIQDSLPVYANHLLGSSIAGTIPAGASVYVSKGNGLLAHVSYNGLNGYASMAALSKQSEARIQTNYQWVYMTIPDDATRRIQVWCSGDLPEHYSLTVASSGPQYVLEWIGWASTTIAEFDLTAYTAEDGVLTIKLMDDDSQNVAACCDLPLRTFIARTTLTADISDVRINCDETDTRTITLTAGGYLPAEYSFEILRYSDEIFFADWPGEWSGSSHDLRLKGTYQGDSSLIIGLRCQDTIRATTEVKLSVSATANILPSLETANLNMKDVQKRTLTLKLAGMLPRQYALKVAEITSKAITTGQESEIYDADGLPAIDVYVAGLAAGSGTIKIVLTDEKTGKEKAVLFYPVTVWDRELIPALDIPCAVNALGDGAFEGISAVSVRIPDGITRIGERVFADCTQMQEIYIPSTVQTIEESSFASAGGLTVFGQPDSYAETFALQKGFAFVPVK